MASGFVSLARCSHSTLDLGEDCRLHISVAPPLDNRAPPSFVLYILDPEFELFATAASHLYSRFNYVSSDDDESASVLRKVALVGVGHHPSLFEAGAFKFSVTALRDLRRKHFRDDTDGSFVEALCTKVVPYCESTLLGITTHVAPSQRALLGSSLSSLPALRTVLRGTSGGAGGGDVFGNLICGSPSLIFTPKLVQDARNASRGPPSATPVRILIIVGEAESRRKADGGNGIPQAAEYTASLLSHCGHRTEMIAIDQETHNSLKPSQVSRALGWLEQCWGDKEAAGPMPTVALRPSQLVVKDDLPSEMADFRAFWQSEDGRKLVARVRAAQSSSHSLGSHAAAIGVVAIVAAVVLAAARGRQ